MFQLIYCDGFSEELAELSIKTQEWFSDTDDISSVTTWDGNLF